ncbi:flagellar biosynthetic protein FliR [Altererythrobacter xixiisoli]|uniref:Flagellar biosynthetic protein FliR n=1 Tax=Croceibacterium xixiisoli TaxID=1476466 RepID=A0A6I4TSZ4_9SPHN|nr:flagellar biosynthetic protein FliR [Croceibacterium xixiisoli]MXO98449.1 flagellar biosynthetic protein FliR [Croceibacterium xixiisoli]
MIGLDFGLGAIEAEFWRVVFLMTRIGAALMAAPVFGAMSVPPIVRVSVTGALAIFVAAWFPTVTAPAVLFSAQGMLAVAGEVLIGLTLGFVLQIAFAAPVMAAELIGGGMGMSMAMASDPGSGGQTTAFGQYFTIVLTLIFLTIGAHLHWIALLTQSYQTFPPGDTWLGAERFELVVSFVGLMFETAVRIALPITLVLLLVQIVTGVLSRSAPSLNLFALGLPAGVLAGLAALIIAAPLIYDQLSDVVALSLEQVESVIAR